MHEKKIDRRAFLIWGPEASGNRMTAKALIAAGCIGDGGHYQRWETEPLSGGPVVWLRSFPLGYAWPDATLQTLDVINLGYRPTAIITIRDRKITARSQVASGHVASITEGESNIDRAYSTIFKAIAHFDIPFQFANYEAIVARKWDALGDLLDSLGLPVPAERDRFEIYDGNKKHLGKPGGHSNVMDASPIT